MSGRTSTATGGVLTPECCGRPMLARATATICDCLACGRSLSLFTHINGPHVSVTPRLADVIHMPGSSFFKYFGKSNDVSEPACWRFARKVAVPAPLDSNWGESLTVLPDGRKWTVHG